MKHWRKKRRTNGAGSQAGIRVGKWIISPARNCVTSGALDTSIEPKVMKVLEILISRQGDVVSRAEIEDAVWPNAEIGEKTLTRAISELRRVFADDPARPEVIETVARRGYRLILPAVPVVQANNVRTGAMIASAIAVLGIVVWATAFRESVGHAVQPWRQLTSQPGHELTPSPSPTGDLVAFARTPKGEESSSIYIKQISGETELRITNDGAFDISPRWSPDGSQIAFLRYDDSACEILTVAALGGDTRKVADCNLRPRRVNFSPTIDWASDGKRIAYVDRAKDARGRCIFVIDLNTGSSTILNAASATECSDDVDPVFSPDGRSIAFTRMTQRSVGDLFVTDLTDGTITRLTADYRSLLGAAWDSDRSIVFSSDRSGTYRLWRVDVPTREIQWLPADGWNIKRPSVNAAGLISYENWQYDTNVWTASAADASPRKIISSTVWDFHPGVSPDGEQVAFVSNRSGNFELWLLEADGTERQLTRSTNRVVGFPSWSRDGERIAYVLQAGDRFEVAVIALDGAELARISSSGNVTAPVWSPNGDTLVYGSDVTKEWQVWAYTFANGDRRQLTRTGGYRGALSDEGDLFFTKPGRAGLWRKQPDREAEKVIDDLAEVRWADWHLTGGRIVYPSSTERRLNVWDYRTPRGSSAVPTLAFGSPNAQSIQVTADLQNTYWTQLDRTEADIVVGKMPHWNK